MGNAGEQTLPTSSGCLHTGSRDAQVACRLPSPRCAVRSDMEGAQAQARELTGSRGLLLLLASALGSSCLRISCLLLDAISPRFSFSVPCLSDLTSTLYQLQRRPGGGASSHVFEKCDVCVGLYAFSVLKTYNQPSNSNTEPLSPGFKGQFGYVRLHLSICSVF